MPKMVTELELRNFATEKFSNFIVLFFLLLNVIPDPNQSSLGRQGVQDV